MYTGQLSDLTALPKARATYEPREASEYEERIISNLYLDITDIYKELELQLKDGEARVAILSYIQQLTITNSEVIGSLAHIISEFNANRIPISKTALFRINFAIFTAYMGLRVILNEEETMKTLLENLRELAGGNEMFNQLVGYRVPVPTQYMKLVEA